MSLLENNFKTPITVDTIIFGFDDNNLNVLLIKRGEAPYENHWALPGYFMREDENLDNAANRILEELTGFTDVYLEQFKTFGAVDRHPAGRIITVAYYSLIKIQNEFPIRTHPSITKKIKWSKIEDAINLAFDHDEILKTGLEQLKQRLKERPIGFELLPREFTLSQLRNLYEIILKIDIDKRNFRKKILSMNLLVDLDKMQAGVAHRPAKLYKFDNDKYKKFLNDGYVFDLSESKPREKK